MTEVASACNFIKKETLTQVLSCEFCETFKNNFLTEHFLATASIKATSNKSFEKYECRHLGGWYIKSTLYTKFLNWNRIFKKIKQLLAKLRSLLQVHFVLPILFALTLASDRAALYGNNAFSILVISTKKQYSSFQKRVWVFQKICFKIEVLKTIKISSDCHTKTCRSLKRRAILKITSTAFQKNLCSFCWL